MGNIRATVLQMLFLTVLQVVTLLPASASSEETLWCRALGVEDGLSQNFITAIAQDQDGFMWFGTIDGLNRWDGHEFESYSHVHDDLASLSDAAVLALHSSRDGSLWVGTGMGLDHFDPMANAFRRYGNFLHPQDVRRRVAVEGIATDRAGRAWCASFAGPLLYRVNPRTGQSMEHQIPGLPRHWVTALFVDSADRLWVATQYADNDPAPEDRGFRLWVFDHCSEIGDEAMPLPRQPLSLDEAGGKIVAILEDQAHRLWLGRNGGGLLRFDPETGVASPMGIAGSNPDALAGAFIRSMSLSPAGDLWVLARPANPTPSDTRMQLYQVDPAQMTSRRIALRQAIPRAGDDAPMERLAVDRYGGLWLGTGSGGLRHADVNSRGFSLHRAGMAGRPGLNSSFVRAICRTRDGGLWVGTPVGLNRVDRSQAEDAYSASSGPKLPNPNVQAICEDRRGNLWIGTAGGLAVLEQPSGRVHIYRGNDRQPGGLTDDYVLVIHEGPDGTLWIGTLGKGLDQWDPQTRTFKNHPCRPGDPASLPSATINALFTDGQGRIWAGTDAGLVRLATSGGGERHFEQIASGTNGLGGVAVLSIAQSTATPGMLWIGTRQRGLCRLNLQDQSCRFHTSRNSGLPNDMVYGILADERGRLWLSSNRGLTRYDPARETFRTYGPQHGLQSSEFNGRAYFQAPDGEMFFGGIGGLSTFHPEQIADNPLPPDVRITRVRMMDRAAQAPEASASLIHPHGLSQSLVEVPYRQRDLTFNFTVLHYSDAAGNRCQFRLDGYDADWQPPVARRQARYTNLDPGRYTFRVKALSSVGVESVEEAVFAFVVLPPFYATIWFYLLVTLGVGASLAGGYHWRVRHLHRRQAALEQQIALRTEELHRSLATVENQATRLRELDSAKSKFFANISHEFRTPLMLTLGPLGDVRDGMHGALSDDARAEIELALRNSRRLLELVNQLLMLARFDAGEPEFHPRELRLDEFLRHAIEPCGTLATRQQIHLRLDLPEDPIWGSFDEAKLDQIIGNLLGNALKFTPAGGSVTLRLTTAPDGWATLVVEDTGPGIPARDLSRVFERFYRGEQENGSLPGTGIGLALARECVELHGGEIRAENRPNGGARFTVRLKSSPAPSLGNAGVVDHTNPSAPSTRTQRTMAPGTFNP